jgi:chromosome segregation ATPase
MSTPKARTTRMSAAEMMPPPPSPQVKAPSAAAAAAAAAATVALEEEIRELKRRNAELEEHASSSEQARAEQYDAAAAQADELEAQIELARKEADELRAQLTSSADDADGVRARGEQLATEVAAKAGEIEELQKRAALHAGELEAGIAAKHKAQNEADEMKRLVDELTAAGNQIIELNESKQYESELKIRELQAQLATAAEDLARAKEGSEAAAAALENSSSPKRAVTAAEIDNETLTEQVKHQQKRIANLEEQLDEVRGQAEADAEAWQVKYDKACAAERAVIESLEQVRRDLQDRDLDVEEHATRNVELQGAMSEKQRMLEAARADIEALRAEASTASEASIADLDNKLKEATDKLSAGVDKIFELEARVSELSEENGMLRAKAENDNDDAYDGISPKAKRTLSLSNGSMDDAERVGFRHIIADLRAENADQQEKLNLLEEENTLLHELKGSEEAGEDEAAKLRGTVAKQAQTIKEYEREVSELESLIESKIYREDELETRVQELEDMWSKNGGAGAAGAAPASSASVTTRAPKHTRTDSAVSNGTARSDLRCELCEGPHELDACPVFSSTTLDADVDAEADADADAHPSPLANKNKKWCNDCESSAHDTAECPMAEDVF